MQTNTHMLKSMYTLTLVLLLNSQSLNTMLAQDKEQNSLQTLTQDKENILKQLRAIQPDIRINGISTSTSAMRKISLSNEHIEILFDTEIEIQETPAKSPMKKSSSSDSLIKLSIINSVLRKSSDK